MLGLEGAEDDVGMGGGGGADVAAGAEAGEELAGGRSADWIEAAAQLAGLRGVLAVDAKSPQVAVGLFALQLGLTRGLAARAGEHLLVSCPSVRQSVRRRILYRPSCLFALSLTYIFPPLT